MNEKVEIVYIEDDTIDDILDQEIRNLLSTCYTKPHHIVFQERRYFREPYQHRWVIRSDKGVLVAHIGVHDKQIECDGVKYRIGGIVEVCVHPDHRGNGYVRMMLNIIHDWQIEQGFVFSVLFTGNPKIYDSSGYTKAYNLFCKNDKGVWKNLLVMFKELSDKSWPSKEVRLKGPSF